MFSAMYSITSVGSSSTLKASRTCCGFLLFKTPVIALKMSERSSFVLRFSTSFGSNTLSVSASA